MGLGYWVGPNKQKARQPKNEKRKRVRCCVLDSACSAPSRIASPPYVSLPHLKNLESASQGSPSRPGPRGAQSEKLPASTRPATGLAAAARRHGARPYKAWSEKNPPPEEGPISRKFFENGRALKMTNLFFVQQFCVFKNEKRLKEIYARAARARIAKITVFGQTCVSLRSPISSAAGFESRFVPPTGFEAQRFLLDSSWAAPGKLKFLINRVVAGFARNSSPRVFLKTL